MNVSPNQRPPCSGSNNENILFVGTIIGANSANNCSQSPIYNFNGITQSKYINITKVQDYHSSPNPNGISPYSRTPQVYSGDCTPANPSCCCNNYTNTCSCCGIPSPSETITCITGSNYSTITQGNFWNCFSQSNITVSTFCESVNFGHKQIYTKKNWLGTYGYLSPTYTLPDNVTWCCLCSFLSITGAFTIDTTKYLSLAATSEYTHTTNGVADISADAGNTTHVGQYNGRLFIDTCYSSSIVGDPDGVYAAQAWSQLGLANPSVGSSVYEAFCGAVNAYGGAYGNPTTITSTGTNSWNIIWSTYFSGCTGLQEVVNLTYTYPGGLHIVVRGINASAGFPCDIETIADITYTATNTSFYHDEVDTAWTESIGGMTTFTTEETTNGSLGSAYTSTQAKADAMTAYSSSGWNIDNNFQYPYRTDNSMVAPLVHYDEDDNSPTITCISSSAQFTGDILGGPLPFNYDHYWNATHPNWTTCIYECPLGGQVTEWYIASYGAWSDDITYGAMTPLATDWVDLNTAQFLYQGKWSGMNFPYQYTNCAGTFTNQFQPETIWLSDFRETKVPRTSFDFARPCGQDRFDVIVADASCITNVSGHTLSVSPNNIPNNTSCLVCGTNQVDGVWNVSSAGGATVTLNTLLITGSQVQSPYTCAGGATIAPLRWPSPPALCGRAYIINKNNGTSSLDRNTYLVNNDNVMTNNAGQQTIQVFSPSQIYLPNSSSVSYIYSPFAPDWQWNDNSSKGDFAILTFNDGYYQFRDIGVYNWLIAQSASFATTPNCDTPGEYCPAPPTIPYPSAIGPQCTQSCIAANPCKNPELYTGITWPSNVVWDSLYGNLNIQIIEQSLLDSLAQIPPYCGNLQWIEDNGTCEADNITTAYYAHRNLVEGRCQAPNGAPPMFIPFTFQIPIQGQIFTYDPELWLAESGCVCSNGRFSNIYLQNGVYCNND